MNNSSKMLAMAMAMAISGNAAALNIVVNGSTATLNGDINSNIEQQIQNLINNHPNVNTLIFGDMPGSNDDDANLRASRLIRQNGFTTQVNANSDIHSGAVDMFAAGQNRIVFHGATIGVHSWAGNGTQGSDLLNDRNNIEHRKYLDYYQEMGIPADFYWLTLKAMPGCDTKAMTEHQIRTSQLSTDYRNGNGLNPNEAAIDELVSGISDKICNDISDSYTRRHVEVPAGTSSLTVRITGGNGDADLFVAFGQEANSNNATCSPLLDGNEEVCVINNPQAGTWHVGVQAYDPYANVNVSATLN